MQGITSAFAVTVVTGERGSPGRDHRLKHRDRRVTRAHSWKDSAALDDTSRGPNTAAISYTRTYNWNQPVTQVQRERPIKKAVNLVPMGKGVERD